MEYTKKLADELKAKLIAISADIPEEEDNVFDVVATTEDVDREGEVIKITSWEKGNWEKNPVVLANHTYTIESIVGKGLQFYEKDGAVRLRGVFSKTNPLGILANRLYNEGMLVAVSVGFIPLLRDANNSKIITKAELLEVSFVAVPCNPNAVRDVKLYEEAISKGLIIEASEEKDVSGKEESIDEIIKRTVRAESGLLETDRSLRVHVVSIYPSYVVYNAWDNNMDNYYKRGFDITNGIFTLLSDTSQVEARTVWIEKSLLLKGNAGLVKEISEVKDILKGMADDKATQEQALQMKQNLQAVSRATSTALEQIKKLNISS